MTNKSLKLTISEKLLVYNDNKNFIYIKCENLVKLNSISLK